MTSDSDGAESQNSDLVCAGTHNIALIAARTFKMSATLTGLDLPEDTPKEVALHLHAELGGMRSANYWHWVDLMEFCGRWGETYDLVARMTGWSEERARKIHAYGKAYRREDRVKGLSFSHHEEAASHSDIPYTERIEALELARDEHWGKERLRAYLQEKLRLRGIESNRRITGKRLPSSSEDLATLAVPESEANEAELLASLAGEEQAGGIITRCYEDEPDDAAEIEAEDEYEDEPEDATQVEDATLVRVEDEYAALRERLKALVEQNADLREQIDTLEVHRTAPVAVPESEANEAELLASVDTLDLDARAIDVWAELSEIAQFLGDLCQQYSLSLAAYNPAAGVAANARAVFGDVLAAVSRTRRETAVSLAAAAEEELLSTSARKQLEIMAKACEARYGRSYTPAYVLNRLIAEKYDAWLTKGWLPDGEEQEEQIEGDLPEPETEDDE